MTISEGHIDYIKSKKLKAETRDKFLDLLSDIVSVDVSNIDPEELKKKIENIISVIEEIKEIFENLESSQIPLPHLDL